MYGYTYVTKVTTITTLVSCHSIPQLVFTVIVRLCDTITRYIIRMHYIVIMFYYLYSKLHYWLGQYTF